MVSAIIQLTGGGGVCHHPVNWEVHGVLVVVLSDRHSQEAQSV